MKFPYPSSALTGEVAAYLYKVAGALNSIPQISYFSGVHPTASGITGVAGNMAVNVGVASNASRLFLHYGSAVIPDKSSWQTIG